MTGIMAKYNLLFTVPHVVLLYVMAVGLSYLTTVGLKTNTKANSKIYSWQLMGLIQAPVRLVYN